MTVDAHAITTRFLVACALARAAGEIAKRRFSRRESFTVGFKGPQDYLTEVDGEVERLIATRLHEAFPGDGFIGEEGEGRVGQPGAPIWVVDPIDGTSNFARGAPHFCVSIAAVVGREVEIGVIYDPMVDELFACSARRRRDAQRRADARLLDRRSQGRLDRGRLEHARRRGGVSRPPRPRRHSGVGAVRSGSGALGLAYVAAGRRDGYVENHIHAWDCLAGVALVREAGGYVSDFLAGEGLREGNPLVACAPGVKDALIEAAAIEGLTL